MEEKRGVEEKKKEKIKATNDKAFKKEEKARERREKLWSQCDTTLISASTLQIHAIQRHKIAAVVDHERKGRNKEPRFSPRREKVRPTLTLLLEHE